MQRDRNLDLITATDKHTFWVVDLATWVDATDLESSQAHGSGPAYGQQDMREDFEKEW
ncbi:hypothetical protein ACGFYU_05815 [Streptomyces sp. NPDC048337]|uniref:hypothetical protein n=1 Tax=Streptomyces sp. NPDC048337 TaxID=3365535 RepID=UPI00371C63F4